jgi:hypothetical protein
VKIHVTEIYAEKLREVAAGCDDDAKVMTPSPAQDPWLVIRKHGDLRLKTFVGRLSYTSQLLFMKTLHNTIANVANGVFSSPSANVIGDQCRQRRLTGENVRQMLRVNAQRIRPGFAPVIMPMVEARRKEIEAELDRRHPR